METKADRTIFESGVIGPEICANCGYKKGSHRATDMACPHPDNFRSPKFVSTYFEEDTKNFDKSYHKGFIDGLCCFTWWKNGEEIVGNCGTLLRHAIERVETHWNYSPTRRR